MASSSLEQSWSSLWMKRFSRQEPRLRFDLGGDAWDGDDHPIPRFLQAFRRAIAIADALFQNGCHAVVASVDDAANPAAPHHVPSAAAFATLRASGFRAAYTSEWQSVLYPDGSDEAYQWTLRGCRLDDDEAARDCLIWHSIAAEMPISPSAPIVAFLLDPSAGTMLHIYDDRGMDVMAHDAAALRVLHATHADWLLGHDRERISATFDMD
ncbi:DUF3885 domain-containing protein [Sphingomonas sanguinis]|uniref:DUF3885 domain-containing protein n=1 Tax=Sphingomonas sanguinis TaxID=33051 RepID=A0ABU5LLW4_9SPHN|nr:DUF3885 domain-containing protein [Sphingomonas sanguinis]MDZ7280925.1 DUF3885 domain-containing protein [Sphingomonas sanguinis]